MENEISKIEQLPEIIHNKAVESQKNNIAKVYNKLYKTIKTERNPILRTISQIPIIQHALKIEKGLKAIIPSEYLEGLENGSLKLLEGKDGSLISTIVDSKTGKVVHQLRLEEFKKLANPAELSQMMNQINMQIQLDEIQKTLSIFKIEVTQRLDEILQILHSNRIIPTETVKIEFNKFLEGLSSKESVLSKISEAQASSLKEIEDSLSIIKSYDNKDSINSEENENLQKQIGYIIESINSLKDLYLIEMYFCNDNKKKEKVSKFYINALCDKFSKENLLLIDAYCDFATLGLSENIWENQLNSFSDTLIPLKEEILKLEEYV